MTRFYTLLLMLITLTGFKGDSPVQVSGLIPSTNMLHIGIVVKDINISLDHWVKLTGKKKPSITLAEGHEANPTEYRGNASDARAKLAFLRLDNITVELIEPVGEEPSHWKEFLDQKGEGVHHIAFEVKGIGEVYVDTFENSGFPMVQKGGWNGGEYAYMEGMETLGVMVELIEHYKKE